MKKSVLFLMLFLVAAVLSFGSGGKEPAATSDTQQTQSMDKKTTINFSSWLVMEDASKATLQEMVKRFEAQNPNIKVELIGIPFEQTQQQTMIAVSGGNAPDLIHLVAQWGPPLAAMGALEDLKKYYTQEELSDIPKAAYEDGLYAEKLITVPWQLGPIAVFAWKDLLVKAGLPLEIPSTWDKFKEAVKKISDLGPDIYGFGARTSKDSNSAFWFFPVMWGLGGQFEDNAGKIFFNNPGTITALNWYKEIGTTKQTPTGMGVREVRNLMGQGKIGFMFDGPWMKGIFRSITEKGEAIDDAYIVGPFPKAKDGKQYGIGNNHVFAVSAQSKVKPEAVKLIKFLTQEPEITKYYYEKNGAVPTYKKLLKDPLYSGDPIAKAFIDSADFAQSVPSKNPNFSAALEFVANAMQESLLGGSPDKAAETADKSIKTLYKQ